MTTDDNETVRRLARTAILDDSLPITRRMAMAADADRMEANRARRLAEALADDVPLSPWYSRVDLMAGVTCAFLAGASVGAWLATSHLTAGCW